MGQSRVSGHFITFEGGEGAGKSTQIKLLAKALRTLGYDVVETREPGGSAGAEALRHVILSGAAENFGPAMEAILFAAARNDHVNEVIRPAVERGAIVLCDRYMDSTRVYQGSDGALTPDFVKQLEAVAIEDMVPDLTIILDIDPRHEPSLQALADTYATAGRFNDLLGVYSRRIDAARAAGVVDNLL